MSNFQSLLVRRRSIRKFTGALLSPDEIRMIIEAALLSPTSKNRHSWEFVAVEEKETLSKLSVCKPESALFIAEAVFAVVVLANPLISDAWVEDASIAAINMQLQAEDLGIGSCWAQVRGRNYSEHVSAGEYINGLLGIPMPMEVLCVIAFGRKETGRMPADLNDLHWENVHVGSYRFDNKLSE